LKLIAIGDLWAPFERGWKITMKEKQTKSNLILITLCILLFGPLLLAFLGYPEIEMITYDYFREILFLGLFLLLLFDKGNEPINQTSLILFIFATLVQMLIRFVSGNWVWTLFWLVLVVFEFIYLRKIIRRLPTKPWGLIISDIVLGMLLGVSMYAILYLLFPLSSIGFPFSRFFSVVSGTAVPEELFFRGVIWTYLINKNWNVNLVLIVQAILFGFWHIGYGNWYLIYLTFLGGILFGLITKKTRGLTAAIVAHAVVNTLFSFPA